MKKSFTAWLLAWGLVLSGAGANMTQVSMSTMAAEDSAQDTAQDTADDSAQDTADDSAQDTADDSAQDTADEVNSSDAPATDSSISVPELSPTDTPEPSPIVDAPLAPTISIVKGGNKRIKIYWGKISNATGYKIYYSTTKTGTYSLAKTISDNGTVKYVKTGLTQKQTYYFKMTAYTKVGSIVAESVYSNVVFATTGAVSTTSKAAKSYSTKAKFKKSPAYTKYAALSKYCTYSKSFPIPGMTTTNVAGFASTKMIPQGICQAGGYYLISAYDYYGIDESVVYILNRSTHTYITTLVLPDKVQANAMAYDGTNIWISRGNYVAYFPYSAITTAVNSGAKFTSLSDYTGYMKVNTKPQVLAYYNGILWEAATNSTSKSYMYGYQITQKDGKCTLTQKYYMAIPSKVQGINFDSSGVMYMTRSYRTNSSKSGYVSQIRTYKPKLTAPSSKGSVAKGGIQVKRTLPALAEGVTSYGNYVYVLYSGCKYTTCKYKVDRVIATKKTYLQ